MKRTFLIGGFTAILVAMLPLLAYAATTKDGELSQLIDAGTLSTDIVDSGGSTVATPSFDMTATSVSTSCQTITGEYGDSNQRVSVDNPGGADNGWTLTIAATGGASAKWVDGAKEYAYNDASGSGCTNGQLTLDPSAATLGLSSGSNSTGITKGSSDSFVSGTTDSITLMTASAGSDDIWNGYLTGIGVSQKIPGNTPAGTYVIDLTQTVTAS